MTLGPGLGPDDPGDVRTLYDGIADLVRFHPEVATPQLRRQVEQGERITGLFPMPIDDPIFEAAVEQCLAVEPARQEWCRHLLAEFQRRKSRNWLRSGDVTQSVIHSLAAAPEARLCFICFGMLAARLKGRRTASCDYCRTVAPLVKFVGTSCVYLLVHLHVCASCVSDLGGSDGES